MPTERLPHGGAGAEGDRGGEVIERSEVVWFYHLFLIPCFTSPLHSKRIIKEIEAFPSAVRLVVKVLSPFTAERLGEGFITFTAFRLVVKVLVFSPSIQGFISFNTSRMLAV